MRYTLFRSEPYFFSCVVCILISTSVSSQVTPPAYNANLKRSIVRTWQAKAPEVSASNLVTKAIGDVQLTTEYVDALGRPLQSVVKKGSLITNTATPTSAASAVDMVSTSIYDEFGREANKYLPSPSTTSDGNFKLNPFGEQNTFYLGAGSSNPIAGQGEDWFYSRVKFDSSSLNRVMSTYAPGDNWAGTLSQSSEANRHGIDMRYSLNTATDAVMNWTITNAALGSFGTISSTAGNYDPGSLTKTVTENEIGGEVIEFKDRNGRLILRKVLLTASRDMGGGQGHSGFLNTYYLYDDLGQLRCVMMPEAERLYSESGTLSSSVIDEHSFRYEYDSKGRMIMKKLPGAAAIYMVYDARDRVVMTQDGHLRATNHWLITLYDGFSRPVQTGRLLNTFNNKTFLQHLSDGSANADYPFTPAGVPSATFWTEFTQTYYDNYDWIAAATPLTSTYTATYNTYFQAVTGSWPHAQSNPQSFQTIGKVTGTKRKVFNVSTYLYTVNIYDDEGRLIQVKSQNNSGTAAVDILTKQYNWSGQLLVEINKQDYIGSTTQTSIVVTQMTYDELNRLVKTEKKLSHSLVNSGAMSSFVTISTIEYDALGQVKKKTIGNKKDPATGNYFSPRQPLQELTYDYNIRGWVLGVNRNYLQTEGQTADGIHFGYELGYDKLSNKSGENFLAAEYYGNINGIVWKSNGDDIRRKYDFKYDFSGRLLKADFEQQNPTDHLWNNAIVNFAMKVGDGISATSAYDNNGNIKRMQHWGMKNLGSSQIDDLTYNYANGNQSNKLLNVADAQNDAQTTLGDFRVSALNPVQTKTTTSVDYVYDANGNLVKDLNKDIVTSAGANGITYNHLNLPEVITVKKDASSNKGTITYTYDVNGIKLKKNVVENPSAANNNTTITTTTVYLPGMVYEGKSWSPANPNQPNYTHRLQFINHEEGRIRFKPGNNTFEYDYMIQDHLGNVRMVLTEEVSTNYYPAATLEGTYSSATPEANSMVNHEKKFYKIDATKIIAETSIASFASATGSVYNNNNGNPPANTSYPAGATPLSTDGSTKLYKLNATTNRTGLEFMIKVMAGDRIDVFAKSYHSNATSVTNANSTALDLLALMGSMLLSPENAAADKGLTAANLNTLNTGVVPSNFFRGNNSEPATMIPKAYVNYILFDEQFKYVTGNFSRIGTSGAVKNHWTADAQLQNIDVQKNGYLFVYVSNESNFDVFFDNLQIIHKPGPILEETHYYPFGLTMAGISSKRISGVENRKRFNGIEHTTDLNMNQYDAFFRTMDPQIGRWWQIDPKPDVALSPYSSMGNNPISFSDPLGDTTVVNRRGYITKQYGKDNLVFLQKGKKLVQIGELGKSINANKIFKNLLNKNIGYAKGIVNPYTFRNLVKNKGEWDLKNNQKTIYGLANSFDKGNQTNTQFSFQGDEYTAEELGNYHYGATGKAVWAFSEGTLLKKAGDAQIAAGTSKPEWQATRERLIGINKSGGTISIRESAPPYGDDPRDQEMIKSGFKYYDTNKNNLKEED